MIISYLSLWRSCMALCPGVCCHSHLTTDFMIFKLQVGFLVTLTANYDKIKTSKELTEYRHAADLELTETTIYDGSHPRRQY